ncbi:hypothetical protein PCG10_008351 [Penicillium crustosum]|uniref:Epoxide hydrolase N-terminal domain-containing protein n=1 Tax=Penicillium crustosum TaxID=36656 RepID=A0A9P5GF72_PENCR|nr:hypothetical protein PCG10_008351 [Penicillium crustosum]
MTSVTPYKIAVPDEQLQQLRQKLEHTTFPDELDASGWDMGVPLLEIKRLVNVWREKFDWRVQEQKLNEQLKQVNVRVGVEGFGELNIHTVFLEATKLIPLLTNNGDGPVFDVVAPSLPNFGFSQGVKKVF